MLYLFYYTEQNIKSLGPRSLTWEWLFITVKESNSLKVQLGILIDQQFHEDFTWVVLKNLQDVESQQVKQ